jgi:hypothetical protein
LSPKLRSTELAAQVRTEALQSPPAPKSDPTFEDKVEAGKIAYRLQVQYEIKALTDDLEYRKVQAAIHAGDTNAYARKQYAYDVQYIQGQLFRLQTKLASIQ